MSIINLTDNMQQRFTDKQLLSMYGIESDQNILVIRDSKLSHTDTRIIGIPTDIDGLRKFLEISKQEYDRIVDLRSTSTSNSVLVFTLV